MLMLPATVYDIKNEPKVKKSICKMNFFHMLWPRTNTTVPSLLMWNYFYTSAWIQITANGLK